MAKKIDASGNVWKQNKAGKWVNTNDGAVVDSAKQIPSERKARADSGNARAWRLGMPVSLCCVTSEYGPMHPVMHRLRGESMRLRHTVKAIDADKVHAVQQTLYSRLDAVQGLSIVQRQQVLSTVQQLSSPTLSFIPECWEEFRHCAEVAVSAVEANQEYLTEILSLDTIIDELAKAEASSCVDLDINLSNYTEPERLNVDMSELPF